MQKIETDFKDVFIIKREIFHDERGFFFENFNSSKFQVLKLIDNYNQDNISLSKLGTLRGLHYQLPPFSQTKYITVLKGEVYDVVVDIQKDSDSFGEFRSFRLSADNGDSLYVGYGYAHGFLALTDDVLFQYKVNGPYNKSSERGIIYSDENLNIDWPIQDLELSVSAKDLLLPTWGQIFR